jgi:hypothetical protein
MPITQQLLRKFHGGTICSFWTRSTGLLICKTKNKVKVEYALRDINKPIGVSEYETKICKSFSKEVKLIPNVIQEELSVVKII